MTQEKFQFQAEVSRLLEIVTHSLYSNKEIFLRELISNAADACDRLRYDLLTDQKLQGLKNTDFKITLTPDPKANTLTLSDNGIGMSKDELITNLGTIAKSGTAAFMETLKDKKSEAANLIGQFGVGFYAAFMVASRVEVITKRAGTDTAFLWESTGAGNFEIKETTKESHGTQIVLTLKDDQKEFLEPMRLRHIVKTYSDFVTIPIFLEEGGKEEQINAAKPLWTLPAKDISEADYKEFYQQSTNAFDSPWDVLHYKVEGVVDYTALLFIPETKPFDLFDPKRQIHVKLFIKRVFITHDCDALLPGFLRFVRGVVDAQDLPLSVSREMLQHEPRLIKMRSGITKKVLGALGKKAKEDPKAYQSFWDNFGAVLKEGLYEDIGQKDHILPLCLFHSSEHADLISLEDYIAERPDGQKEIYYLTGSDVETLKNSPQLEGFRAKKINVLLLTDPVDEFWLTMVHDYKDHPFKAITSADIDLSALETDKERTDPAKDTKQDPLTNLEAFLKVVYGASIKDVKTSARLTSSPVCLVASEDAMNLQLAKLMGRGQEVDPTATRTLEINPTHPVIQHMNQQVSDKTQQQALEDMAWLLLDEALIVEGLPPKNPGIFATRLNRLLEKK